jgi:hypothetical protein
MNIASISLSATAQSLKTLIGAKAPNEAALLIVQAPAANGAVAYFGDSAQQIFELAAGDPLYYVPADIPGGRINLNMIYFKGTAPDKINAWWVELNKSE